MSMFPKRSMTRPDTPEATARPARSATVVLGAAAAGALALIAAACGSSESKPAASGLALQSQPPAPASAARSAPIAVETANARYGKILTTAQGFALYTYTADEPGGPGCSGTCLQYWPPLLLPAGTTHPIGGPGVTGLGAFPWGSRLQVTFGGLPLYTYIGDKQPGQVTGQNVVDSGGTWRLAVINAVESPSAAGPPETNPTPPVTTANTQAPPASAPMMVRSSPTVPPTTSPPATTPPVTSPPPTAARTTPPTTAPAGLPSY
jgi:predicted lipoprotein with Yx(FWY)xxD motif